MRAAVVRPCACSADAYACTVLFQVLPPRGLCKLLQVAVEHFEALSPITMTTKGMLDLYACRSNSRKHVMQELPMMHRQPSSTCWTLAGMACWTLMTLCTA